MLTLFDPGTALALPRNPQTALLKIDHFSSHTHLLSGKDAVRFYSKKRNSGMKTAEYWIKQLQAAGMQA
jgi:hypothetical protein